MSEANSILSNVLVGVFALAGLLTWAVTSWTRHREDRDARFARRHRL